ncbi:MAG TPA: MraY family glycosyltransferase, partial [Desulfomonilia bacterium]|nr:MraY family glycosyltransferase [Desulfomonilia bacterium]
MIYFSTLFISLFISMSLIPVLRQAAFKFGAVDLPSERKVHLGPIPKIGGLAIALGSLAPVFLWAPRDRFVISLLIGSAVIVLAGFFDDIFEWGYAKKFIAQIAAALIAIFIGGVKITSLGQLLPGLPVLPDPVAVPLTLIVIVGVTNAINLSDGLDGLAGGISLMSFLCIGYLAFCSEQSAIAMFSVTVSGALFGFLIFNTHPATVFMGDSGSQLLGYLAITLSLSLSRGMEPLSTMLPVILLGFPILDTITVMCERIARGVSPFKADKNHFHNRLIKLGFLHKESVLCIYLIQSLLVVFALRYRFYSEWFLLIVYLAFAGAIIAGFHMADRSGWTFSRIDYVDRFFSTRLGALKRNNLLIRISFPIVEIGLPLLLITTALIPTKVPPYVAASSAFFMVIISLIWKFRKEMLPRVLRICLYLIIPFITYLDQDDALQWMGRTTWILYCSTFLFLFVFAILTVKYTRRRRGFRSTPMDFLILIVALVLPMLSGEMGLTHQMGLLAVKILIF